LIKAWKEEGINMATCSITRRVQITEKDVDTIVKAKPTPLFYEMIGNAEKRREQRQNKHKGMLK